MQLNITIEPTLSLKDLAETHINFKREVWKIEREIADSLKNNLLQQCADVFIKNPQIKSFIWSQFMPDDTMTFVPVFNVQELCFLSFIPEKSQDITSYLHDPFEDIKNGDFIIQSKSLKKDTFLTTEGRQTCQQFIYSLYNCFELLELAFGSNVAIFVTPDSYKVLDYSEHY